MGYSVELLVVVSVFLCTYPVEAAVAEVKIGLLEKREQGRDEASQLYQLGVQQYEKSHPSQRYRRGCIG